jgi:hypothetical protein
MSTLLILNKVPPKKGNKRNNVIFLLNSFSLFSLQARNLEKIIAECLLLHACWIAPADCESYGEEDRARIASDNALILSKYGQALAMLRQELQASAGIFPPLIIFVFIIYYLLCIC